MLAVHISNSDDFLSVLPDEVIKFISEFFQLEEIFALGLVNKRLQRILIDENIKYIINLINTIYPIDSINSPKNINIQLNDIAKSQQEEIVFFKNHLDTYPHLLESEDFKGLHRFDAASTVSIKVIIINEELLNKINLALGEAQYQKSKSTNDFFPKLLTRLIIIDKQHITKIVAKNLKLKSLVLEKLPTLTTLICSENQLKNIIGLEKLISLQTLYCDNNLFVRFPSLEKLSELKFFRCSNNQLKAAPKFHNFSKLEYFNCSHNHLSSLFELQTLQPLLSLYCHNNQLSDLIGIEKLTSLGTIDCSFNQISKLSTLIKELNKLTFLICNDNQLTFEERNLINCFKPDVYLVFGSQHALKPSSITDKSSRFIKKRRQEENDTESENTLHRKIVKLVSKIFN